MGLLDRFKKDKREHTAPKAAKVVRVPKEEVKKDVEEKKLVETVKNEDLNNAPKTTIKDSSAYKVLLRPLVSEKSALSESLGVYTFVVDRNANKYQIKQAIETIYKVRPVKVRMVNIMGKVTRHGRSIGRRSDWKKAVITLSKGQTISIHEGV